MLVTMLLFIHAYTLDTEFTTHSDIECCFHIFSLVIKDLVYEAKAKTFF